MEQRVFGKFEQHPLKGLTSLLTCKWALDLPVAAGKIRHGGAKERIVPIKALV